MSDVVHELDIQAPQEIVYRCFTDAEELGVWMDAHEVTVDARAGGLLVWTHDNGHRVSGEYRELVPYRRVRFSYGWEDGWHGVAAGSTEVDVSLSPLSGGTATRLRLIHRDLDADAAAAHEAGWAFFLGRLSDRHSRHGEHQS